MRNLLAASIRFFVMFLLLPILFILCLTEPVLSQIGENDSNISQILKIRARLKEWRKHRELNSLTPPQKKIDSIQSRGVNGIENPSIVSIKSNYDYFNFIMESMPQEMRDFLESDVNLEGAPLINDNVFAIFESFLEVPYQTAIRINYNLKYLNYYSARRKNDVRSYYALKKLNLSPHRLNSLDLYNSEEDRKIFDLLINFCSINYQSLDNCRNTLTDSLNSKNLSSVFVSYMSEGEKKWNSFFSIPEHKKNKKFLWTKNGELIVPFKRHKNENINSFLKENIEDEFRWNGFSIKIDFQDTGDIPYMTVIPETLTRVSNNKEMILDENMSLNDWNSKWAIRHEFGHILGLPDCYLEFYDSDKKEFVSYALNESDLMCVTSGRMNQRIFDELKRAYVIED